MHTRRKGGQHLRYFPEWQGAEESWCPRVQGGLGYTKYKQT